MESVWLAGSDVFCPCCWSNWRQFAPGGVNKRVCARCPKCGALERHRLFALYFKARPKLVPVDAKVLHVAPEGPIERLFYARDDVDYIRGDLRPQRGELPMDVCALPFSDGELNLVVATHVLEHVIDDGQAMREIYRVLRPGGVAILLSSIDWNRLATYEDSKIVSPGARRKAFGHEGHVRVYGLDMIERLRQAGFQVEIDPFWQKFTVSDRLRYGLLAENMILGWKS